MRAWQWILVGVVTAYSVGAAAYLLGSAPAPPEYPALVLETSDGGASFTVVEAEAGLQWEDFVPYGCNRRPSGPISVGDQITECGGKVALQYVGG